MTETSPVATTRVVDILGYGGLLPFVTGVVLMRFDHERAEVWHGMIRAYGAVILSFVGALHWGIATTLSQLPANQRRAMFVWSVVPCLLAFASLLLHSGLGDLLLLGGFVLHYVQDLRLAARVSLPAWFLPLRLQLTTVVILCIVIADVRGL